MVINAAVTPEIAGYISQNFRLSPLKQIKVGWFGRVPLLNPISPYRLLNRLVDQQLTICCLVGLAIASKGLSVSKCWFECHLFQVLEPLLPSHCSNNLHYRYSTAIRALLPGAISTRTIRLNYTLESFWNWLNFELLLRCFQLA